MADDYIQFLTKNHVDRERVNWAKELMIQNNFKLIEIGGEEALKSGDKFYYINKNKNITCGMIGQKPEFTIYQAHADYPHIDLKPNFVTDNTDCCMLKTHYYGGIKKYQYATTPMMIKIIHSKNGATEIITIGDQPTDPVFTIPDLLIHLSANIQGERKMKDVVKATEMNFLGSSIKGEFTKFSDMFYQLFEQRTGLTKKDLQYCEI